MSFTAEFEYRLDDFKVCAKGLRLQEGAKFYRKIAIVFVLTLFFFVIVSNLFVLFKSNSGEELWSWPVYIGGNPILLDRIIMLLVFEAVAISNYTDKARSKPLMKSAGYGKKRLLINDAGVTICDGTGECTVWYHAIMELYFSKGLWLLFFGDDTGDKVKYVLVIPARGFTEGDPAQFGAYLSRMCGKEVKRF